MEQAGNAHGKDARVQNHQENTLNTEPLEGKIYFICGEKEGAIQVRNNSKRKTNATKNQHEPAIDDNPPTVFPGLT